MRSILPLLIPFIFVAFVNCQTKVDLPYPSVEQQKLEIKKRGNRPAKQVLSTGSLVSDFRYLASDTCEGRGPGSAGHERAAERIRQGFIAAGIDSFSAGMYQQFAAGKNVLGVIKGAKVPEKYIIVSAHYDHLGKTASGTFYGADDNAGGAACLPALANYFSKNKPAYSLLFVAFDLEERGLKGSNYFVDHLPEGLKREQIVLNLNLDMIARSDKNEIYACGVYHYPQFKKVIEQVRQHTSLYLLMGHDAGSSYDDWTNQSDHYPFYKAGIPFLYIGVEDHEDYHQPTDTFDKVDLKKYLEACNMIAEIIEAILAGQSA